MERSARSLTIVLTAALRAVLLQANDCDDGNECTLDAACDLGTGLCPPPTPVPAPTVCDDVFVNRYAPATGWEGEQVIFSDPP